MITSVPSVPLAPYQPQPPIPLAPYQPQPPINPPAGLVEPFNPGEQKELAVHTEGGSVVFEPSTLNPETLRNQTKYDDFILGLSEQKPKGRFFLSPMGATRLLMQEFDTLLSDRYWEAGEDLKIMLDATIADFEQIRDSQINPESVRRFMQSAERIRRNVCGDSCTIEVLKVVVDIFWALGGEVQEGMNHLEILRKEPEKFWEGCWIVFFGFVYYILLKLSDQIREQIGPENLDRIAGRVRDVTERGLEAAWQGGVRLTRRILRSFIEREAGEIRREMRDVQGQMDAALRRLRKKRLRRLELLREQFDREAERISAPFLAHLDRLRGEIRTVNLGRFENLRF